MRLLNHYAYLLIAQETLDTQRKKALLQLVEKFHGIFPNRKVKPAFLGSSRASIPRVIRDLVRKGTQEIFVLPFISSRDRQVRQEIPMEIQAAKRSFPELDFHYVGQSTIDSVFLSNIIKGLKT